MTGVQILQAIIEILVGGFVGIGEGLGQAFSTLAENIFLTTVGDATTLSVFGSLVVVFAGISLALGKLVLPYMVTYIEELVENRGKLKCQHERKLYFNIYNTCNA